MSVTLRALKSLANLAPAHQRFVCECYWCEEATVSRSEGVAWLRMSIHLGFGHGPGGGGGPPADPADLDDSIRSDVEDATYPSLEVWP